MQPGDGFAYYASRVSHPEGAPVQAFTAIGRVAGGPAPRLRLSSPVPDRAGAVPPIVFEVVRNVMIPAPRFGSAGERFRPVGLGRPVNRS